MKDVVTPKMRTHTLGTKYHEQLFMREQRNQYRKTIGNVSFTHENFLQWLVKQVYGKLQGVFLAKKGNGKLPESVEKNLIFYEA